MTTLKAVVFVILLVAAAWLLWPFLAPRIDRAKQAEPAKVLKVSPLGR